MDNKDDYEGYEAEDYDIPASEVLGSHVCPICGKVMYRLSWADYAYKLNTGVKTLYFCSWNHYRQGQLKQQEKKHKKSNIVKRD